MTPVSVSKGTDVKECTSGVYLFDGPYTDYTNLPPANNCVVAIYRILSNRKQYMAMSYNSNKVYLGIQWGNTITWTALNGTSDEKLTINDYISDVNFSFIAANDGRFILRPTESSSMTGTHLSQIVFSQTNIRVDWSNGTSKSVNLS